ncbi:hypothetical protein DQ04_03021090 [Trypanosoma grayi]|uniref:hypothetical protein n=1 Tax=Trypanosoma grayi TaxID=71804 RepID=UPI0004F46A3B|nr:hypothetical protein DQ04_03021090 [Trypanosoma grayi]KEG11062.1 hypothetical protein DQ04_03021090 [Trypanosoma grayi]
MCLIWHLICCVLTIVAYVVWSHTRPQRVEGGSWRGAHLAFSVIGMVAYAVGGAPLFVYAYKYGLSYNQRQTRLLCGMAVVFLTWSFPIFVIEMGMLRREHDYKTPLDGIVFVLSIISAIIGGCVVWFSYMRLVTHYMHQYHGMERQIDPQSNMAAYPMQPVRASSRAERPDTI